MGFSGVRGKRWERQQRPSLRPPSCWGEGWRVWGAQSRAEGTRESSGNPEGRDKRRMEDLGAPRREGSRKDGGFGVWQCPATPRPSGGGSQPSSGHRDTPLLLTHPRGRASSLRGSPELRGEKPARSRANQSREEPVGTARAGTETLQDKVKKVTLRKLKSNNVLPPKSTGGALARGPKAGTEKWRGRGGGSARALPSHPPATGSGLKET